MTDRPFQGWEPTAAIGTSAMATARRLVRVRRGFMVPGS
jgi:hypothetical protein